MIRLPLEESPIFAKANEQAPKNEKLSLMVVLRTDWKQVLSGGLTMSSTAIPGYILIAYILSYGVNVLEIPKPPMIKLMRLGSVIWLFTCLLFATWSDRWGRRRYCRIDLGISFFLDDGHSRPVDHEHCHGRIGDTAGRYVFAHRRHAVLIGLLAAQFVPETARRNLMD